MPPIYYSTARVENWKGTTLSFILHYQDSEGIETDSVRNPPRPVKQPRLGSFTSDRLFDEDSELSEGSEDTELTLPLLHADCCDETIVTDTFYCNKQRDEE
jgi:hypothetical protein